jgi:hypothetical protein
MSVFPAHVLLLRAADGAHAKYTIVNDWNANEVGYPVHVPTPAGPVSGDNSHRSYFPTYRSLLSWGLSIERGAACTMVTEHGFAG